MTPPVRRRLTIEPLPGGQRRVSLRCPCARVERVAQLWESDADVMAELRAEHVQVAPRCPHRSPVLGATP